MSDLLITGATGFLGGHVLDALRVRMPAARLFVLVRNRDTWQRSQAAARHPDAIAIVSELSDAAALATEPALQNAKVLVHLAALVRHSRHAASEVYAANVAGTRAAAMLAAELRARMVFVSTSGTVGCALVPDAAPNEAAPYATDIVKDWPYYDSKIAAEMAATEVMRAAGANLTIVRPPAILGPGDERGRATGLVTKFLRRKLPFCLEGGNHIVDVRDVAMAVAKIAASEQARPIYHLPGHAEPLSAFFLRLERLSNIPAPRRTLPFALAHGIARLTAEGGERLFGRPLPPRIDPVMVEMGRCFWGLSSKYAHELGFVPRPLDATLKDTLKELLASD